MAKYKFKKCEGYDGPISKAECRLSCGGRKINPCNKYYLELLSRLKAQGVDYQYPFLPPEGFDATGSLNPFQIVADLYVALFHDDWEICLSRKQNISDCVYGCNSMISDENQPLFHPHQWCGRMKEVKPVYASMVQKLSATVERQEFHSFEDIYNHVASQKEPKFGDLAIYDASLRLAWHSGEDQKEQLLPRMVYLHQGAYEGALSLFKLGLLKGIKQAKELEMPVEASCFPYPISTMEPHHIENLLCIFKPLFYIWVLLLLPDPQKKQINKL